MWAEGETYILGGCKYVMAGAVRLIGFSSRSIRTVTSVPPSPPLFPRGFGARRALPDRVASLCGPSISFAWLVDSNAPHRCVTDKKPATVGSALGGPTRRMLCYGRGASLRIRQLVIFVTDSPRAESILTEENAFRDIRGNMRD